MSFLSSRPTAITTIKDLRSTGRLNEKMEKKKEREWNSKGYFLRLVMGLS
jgi:hypothetical protein